MSELKTFNCTECGGKLEPSDMRITSFDSSEMEVAAECCNKMWTTFIQANEFYVQE